MEHSVAPAELSAGIEGTIRSLRVDQVTAEVISALHAQGVASIVLKGPALVGWLYGDGSPRTYVDTDLLVSPADRAHSERLLTELGFAKLLDDSDTSGWRQAAHHWTRASDGANVDLHRTLVGVGVGEQELWATLAARTESINVSAVTVQVPSPAARAFHLALHAAQHGAGGGKHLRDVERGLELIEPGMWAAAAALAERLRATEAFAAGLRLVAAGSRLADELGLPHDRSVETALRASSPVAGALGWNNLALVSGFVPRLHFAARKLFPTPRFMRAWSPVARRGRLGLACAYLGRPVWVMWRAVPGFLAWWRARHATVPHKR